MHRVGKGIFYCKLIYTFAFLEDNEKKIIYIQWFCEGSAIFIESITTK